MSEEMERSEEGRAPLGLVEAWVWTATQTTRVRGVTTALLAIYPGVLDVQPTRVGRRMKVPQLRYDAPVVFLDRITWFRTLPWPRTTGLLMESEGTLARVVVRKVGLTRRLLRQAGFAVVEVTHQGYGEVPSPLTAEQAGPYRDQLPPSFFRHPLGGP